jgi:predicted metal-dependent hydrolase
LENPDFLQRMKTKKPKDLLEYVIVHEMAHLIESTHSSRFVAILDEHYPAWRDARSELNDPR